MGARAYQPGVDNAPFGNKNTNPQASEYALISGYTPQEEILIAKAIRETIFDAAPEQYNALKLLYQKPFEEVGSDEFEYLEYTFGRTAVQASAGSVAVAAVLGSEVTQNVTMVAGSVDHITLDEILIYPDGTKGIVRAIVGNVVTIASQTSAGLPAVTANDFFAIQSTIYGDGMSTFSNYERPETITRYNFVQFFLRASRWNRIERQKYVNQGTTNYLMIDQQHKLKQIRTDLFNTLFNGQRGEFKLADGTIAKSAGGIYPSMVAAGSMSANPTVAGLLPAFKALAFATNYKKEGATRFIYGSDEILSVFKELIKTPFTRYAPNDKIADLNLDEVRIGTMRFVFVNCELFRENSCFPAEWRRKILVLDQETIQPVVMKGLPAMNMGATLDKGPDGTREAFKDFYVEAQLSLRFNNPLASFWLDVQ